MILYDMFCNAMRFEQKRLRIEKSFKYFEVK